jgi:hypothetical protein
MAEESAVERDHVAGAQGRDGITAKPSPPLGQAAVAAGPRAEDIAGTQPGAA